MLTFDEKSEVSFDTKAGVDRVEEGVDRLNQREESKAERKEREAIIEWLEQTKFDSRARDRYHETALLGYRAVALRGFCRFQAWTAGSKSTLFCPGIPGAGKTILSAAVIDHLQNNFDEDDDGVAYVT